jgi:site-specific DNA-methyltransferase (adenine-specific)
MPDRYRRVKPTELLNIGDGSFWLGDCLELMPNISDASINMVICDLPYGTTACAWDTVIPFNDLWKQYRRLIRGSGAIVLTASQPFTSALVMSNPKMFKVEWIWRKNEGSGFALSRTRPIKYHESVLVFANGVPVYNPQKTARTSEQSRERTKTPVGSGKALRSHGTMQHLGDVQYDPNWKNPESVLDVKCVPNGGGKKIHPTQKPVELFEYFIKTYTNPGDIVLDNCSGSGTTAVAAQSAGRRWVCIEKDPIYYRSSCERVRTMAGSLFNIEDY